MFTRSEVTSYTVQYSTYSNNNNIIISGSEGYATAFAANELITGGGVSLSAVLL